MKIKKGLSIEKNYFLNTTITSQENGKLKIMSNIKKIHALLQLTLYDFFRISHSANTIDSALHDAVKWLSLAQDNSPDDGVSEGYHLKHGWLPSYPETTGYIIETLCDYSALTADTPLKERALRMADWLINIQYEDGAIPDSYFKNKMVFDTGQVLFGFVRAYEETGKQQYREAALRAGKWLVDVQEQDGTWQKYAVGEIPHTYYARVAWSMTRLHSITGDDQFNESCSKNIEWVLTQQQDNGWFDNASFTTAKNDRPYTHTIAYTIRGILESGMYLQCDKFIDAARKAMLGLLKTLPDSGLVWGSYDKNWQGNTRFSCLTGDAQLAIIFFKLYQITNEERYLTAGQNINKYLLSKQEKRISNKNIFGALAGSCPVWGEYIHFMYPNWAVKFYIDSLLLEKQLTA